MRNIADRPYREDQNTHFMFNNFPRKSNRLWGNVEKYGRARQATDNFLLRRMRIALWITETTDAHSEYVLIIAFLWQQR